jgi:hypothetical protein
MRAHPRQGSPFAPRGVSNPRIRRLRGRNRDAEPRVPGFQRSELAPREFRSRGFGRSGGCGIAPRMAERDETARPGLDLLPRRCGSDFPPANHRLASARPGSTIFNLDTGLPAMGAPVRNHSCAAVDLGKGVLQNRLHKERSESMKPPPKESEASSPRLTLVPFRRKLKDGTEIRGFRDLRLKPAPKSASTKTSPVEE